MAKAEEIAVATAGAEWPAGCGVAMEAANRALEWAAEQCDRQESQAKTNGWREAERQAHNLAIMIRAGKSTP